MDNYKKLKVLIVDDVASLRTKMKEILKDIGFRDIDEATSGNEAWFIIESQENEPYDLIISDINMTEGNGIGLLKRLKENPTTSTIPTILASTINEKEIILKAISMGVSNYILKPFNFETVKDKIDSCFIDEEIDSCFEDES